MTKPELTFRQEYESKLPRALSWFRLPRRFVMAHSRKVIIAALAGQLAFGIGYPVLGLNAFLTSHFNQGVALWASWLYMAFFLLLMLTLSSLHHYRMLDLLDEIDSTMGLHRSIREALTEVELEALAARMNKLLPEKALH